MKLIRPVAITTAMLTSSTVPETDYAEWSSGTTYALGDYVIVAADHRVYKSIQGSNTNHNPTTDSALATPLWWQNQGATNRWRAFDSVVAVQAARIGSVNYVLQMADRVDSVVLLNVAAETVQVVMTDTVDGIVYNSTVSMVSDSGISDWYAYFFQPVSRRSDIAFTSIPPYGNASLSITVTDAGDLAAVGEIVMGLSREIGGTQYGARIGIRDYSVKEQDDFGNYTILERAFSKRGTFTLWLSASIVSELQTLLAEVRATPTVYIGSDTIDATILFGFYKDFEIDIAYPDVSICSLEVEGLT